MAELGVAAMAMKRMLEVGVEVGKMREDYTQ